MLETLFVQILNMSFTASIAIAFVLFLRLGLRKMPKIFSYALWAVVLFRLVCPFSFESFFSLIPVKTTPISQDIIYQQTPKIDTGITIINDIIKDVLPPAAPTDSVNPMQVLVIIGSFLWLIGIVALVAYSVASLIILKRRLRGAVCDGGNVYIAEGLISPFVMGLFRPKIYLPINLTKDEKKYILLHEKTHIKRLDHLVKIVSFAVLCLHWFNPLVWVSFFLCGKDMEKSCDESVIKQLGSDCKKDYSSSLLTLATGRKIVGGSPLAFGEGDTKSRIKNVLNYKKPTFWMIVVSIIAVAIVGIGLMANPKKSSVKIKPSNNTLLKEDTFTKTDFSALTITKHLHGEDYETIKITDKTTIDKLNSSLLSGKLTVKTSVQDIPNKESYIQISFNPANGVSDFYVYEDSETYYAEQPYNGIREVSIATLEQILSIFESVNANMKKTPAAVEEFLNEISQSFQIKEGVARFIVPEKMPEGYTASQLSVHVSGTMPMGDDGSNMSLHAYEIEDEASNWQLGEEYIERMLGADVPDGTEIYASFYLSEDEAGNSRYHKTVSKIFPLRDDNFTPSVSVVTNGLSQTVTFSDRFNDKLTLVCSLPVGWSFKAHSKGEQAEIFADNIQVGSLSYDNFKLYQDENGNISYMSVYNGIMLGSMASWDNEYTEISTDKITSVATCRPWRNLSFPGVSNAGAPTIFSKGILAYNVKAQKYIAMHLEDSSITEEQLQTIAKSVKLSTP